MAQPEGDGVNQLSLGVMARSRKENERRVPIHPQPFARIPDDLRAPLYLRPRSGESLGVSDDQLKGSIPGFRAHEELIEECDVILQPKPLLNDISELRV